MSSARLCDANFTKREALLSASPFVGTPYFLIRVVRGCGEGPPYIQLNRMGVKDIGCAALSSLLSAVLIIVTLASQMIGPYLMGIANPLMQVATLYTMTGGLLLMGLGLGLIRAAWKRIYQ